MEGSKEERVEARTGRLTAIEQMLDQHLGNTVHLFLSLLAVLILLAAAVATVEIMLHEFPKLWQQQSEYDALYQFLGDMLLVAIAAELALLMLLHRTSAAIEVVIFVVARKMVNPEISGVELILSVAALAGLVIVRYYYIPGKKV